MVWLTVLLRLAVGEREAVTHVRVEAMGAVGQEAACGSMVKLLEVAKFHHLSAHSCSIAIHPSLLACLAPGTSPGGGTHAWMISLCLLIAVTPPVGG
jgi:hypothetical protein